MVYQFEFRPYKRKFIFPIITSYGSWELREGIIIQLRDAMNRVSWGEIAPISWFGSETLDQALDFCQQSPKEITAEYIYSIPNTLPACQFGFESALIMKGEEKRNNVLSFCGLLPSGEEVLNVWNTLWNKGYTTFKWKIGVKTIISELEILHELIQQLPTSAKLRLDANGGLSEEQAKLWLENCDYINNSSQSSTIIEFLEQPLKADKFESILRLSLNYQTMIALDESAATLDQLRDSYEKGWQGLFIIKPGIAGYPSHLHEFCQQNQIDAVFSSVMETAIGRQAALELARKLTIKSRAVGFGINHWFTEDQENYPQQLW